MTHTGNPVAFFIGLCIGFPIGWLLAALLIRLCVRIVAGYSPGILNVSLAMLLTLLAAFVIGIVFGVAIRFYAFPRTLALLSYPVSFIASALLYGAIIHDSNGNTLGFLRAILVDILKYLFLILIAGIFIGIGIAIGGWKPFADDFRRGYANGYAKAQAAIKQAQPASTPQSPAWTQLLSGATTQPTPAPAYRYYLVRTTSFSVNYGTVTFPANTEVQLTRDDGDNSEIQIGPARYKVSKVQLNAVAQ